MNRKGSQKCSIKISFDFRWKMVQFMLKMCKEKYINIGRMMYNIIKQLKLILNEKWYYKKSRHSLSKQSTIMLHLFRLKSSFFSIKGNNVSYSETVFAKTVERKLLEFL